MIHEASTALRPEGAFGVRQLAAAFKNNLSGRLWRAVLTSKLRLQKLAASLRTFMNIADSG
jgi:hypothetical protein